MPSFLRVESRRAALSHCGRPGPPERDPDGGQRFPRGAARTDLSNASASTQQQDGLVDYRRTLSPCCVKYSANCRSAGSINPAQISRETVSALHSRLTDRREFGRPNAYPSADAVYGSDAMKRVKAFIGLTLMVESANVLLGATELRAGALKAWDGYV